MTDTMPEPYAYCVVYDLGTGDASTFWCLDITRRENDMVLHGHTGEDLQMGYGTPYIIKEKPRMETPNYVIADVEDCEPGEVEKGGS